MEKYESKQVLISKPASIIYNTLSSFSNFTPILKDKVEEWSATEDSCSFKIKGFTVNLRIIEREENKTVKVTGEDGSPFDFTFWMQLVELSQNETKMRLVLHVELNMMMKMMVGGKLKDGINQMVDQIATSFNA